MKFIFHQGFVPNDYPSPPFLDPNSFLDHVVAPYPNGPYFSTSPTIIISPNPNASSFASPHVQNFQNHELIPHVHMFDSLSNMELDPLCKKQKFFEGKTQKKSYNNIWKLQIKWEKMPWAKGIVVKDGFINMLKCKMCPLIEKKKKSWVASGTF